MKFHGKIGFWVGDVETIPGIYKPSIVEKTYVGDLIRNSRRWQPVNDRQNSDIIINNQLSILSDLYLRENFDSIRYVLWNGVKWSISSIEIGYPRVTIEIGGVYNGEEETRAPEDSEQY